LLDNKGNKMEITLRKANALQQLLQEAIRNIEVKATISLNEFEDSEKLLEEAKTKVFSQDNTRAGLTTVLYGIRKAVARANTTSGISDLLADAAYIDKRISQITPLTTKEVVKTSSTVINGKLDKIKNRKEDNRASLYGYNDTVETGVLDETQQDAFKFQLQDYKKEKQAINDKLLELNVSTRITLEDDFEAILAVNQLL
jgi:hypothetical protein